MHLHSNAAYLQLLLSRRRTHMIALVHYARRMCSYAKNIYVVGTYGVSVHQYNACCAVMKGYFKTAGHFSYSNNKAQ